MLRSNDDNNDNDNIAARQFSARISLTPFAFAFSIPRSLSLLSLVVVVVVAALVLGAGRVAEARTSPTLRVKLSHGGSLVGRHLTSHSGRHVRAFMGVPYALPPIGELRFKSPMPYGAWTGDRMALEDSDKCTQRDPFRREYEIAGSEDCLYLNVYIPEKPNVRGPLPVMVWFHGGGWICGAGISGFYGPDFFMDRDVVLVGANFRLGPLGFLSTETTECPGNFGLKDQVEVLKWVQKNIAAFGGDPNSVTIFGESAGGASVTYHMLSDQSKGLFHRAIAQSGTYFNPWAQPAHKGVPAKRARKLAQLIGCGQESAWNKVLNCLRQKKAEDITAIIYDLFEWDFDPMIPFPPVVEPKHKAAFLTVQPRSAGTPHGLSLPLMIGATSDEGLLKTASLLNLPNVLNDFKKKFNTALPIILNYDHHAPDVRNAITKQIKSFYLKEGHNYDKHNHQNISDLISDGWFIGGIDEYLRVRLRAAQKMVGPTYVYLFEQKGSASFSELFHGGREDYYGACHAEELQYLFPVGHTLFVSAPPSQTDIAVREAMLSMWVNFANTSNPTPSGSDLPKWKPSKSYPADYVHIGSKNEDNWSLLRSAKAMMQERSDFWHNLKPHPHHPAATARVERDDL